MKNHLYISDACVKYLPYQDHYFSLKAFKKKSSMNFKDVFQTDGYKTSRTPGGMLRPSELPTVCIFFNVLIVLP